MKGFLLGILILLMSTWNVAAQNELEDGWLSDSLLRITSTYISPKTDSALKVSIDYFDSLEPQMLVAYDELNTAEDSFRMRKLLALNAIFRRRAENKLEKAQELLLKAVPLFNTNSDHHQYTKHIEVSLANIATREFDYDRANYWHFEALKRWEILDKEEKVFRSIKNLANNYIYQADTQNAFIYLRRMRDIIEDDDKAEYVYHYLSAQLEYDYLTNSIEFPKNYELYYKLIKRVDTSEWNRVKAYIDSHLLHAQYLTFNNQLSKALSEVDRAIELITSRSNAEISRVLADCLNLKSIIVNKAGRYEEALKYAQQGIGELLDEKCDECLVNVRDYLYSDNKFISLYKTLGNIYLEKFIKEDVKSVNYLSKAFLSFQNALYVSAMIESDLNSKNTLRVHAIRHRSIINKAIDIAYELYAEYNAVDIDVVKSLFIQAKNRLWLDNQRKLYHATKLSVQDAQLVAEYRRQLLHQVNDPLEQLVRIDSMSSIYNNYGYELPSVTEIVGYYDYLLTDSSVYLLTDLHEPYLVRLGDRYRLEESYKGFENTISDVNSLEYQEHLIALTNILLPFKSMPESMVVIADAFLANFPFDILYFNGDYLIKNTSISYAYHHWEYAIESRYSDTKVYLLQPDYSHTFSRTADDRARLGVLVSAASEVNDIARIYGNNAKLLDRNVSPENLLKEAPNGIFHFAGHAIAESRNTYLAFTDNENSFRKLTAEEIYFWPNQYELVVLSACRTGLGDFENGEGIQSLSGNFLQSGTKSVVHTNWVVNDKCISQIISQFYVNLTKGSSKAGALRDAKLNFIKNCSPGQKHPYYWAGINLVGNPDSLTVYSPLIYNYWLLFLLIILICIYAIIYYKRTSEFICNISGRSAIKLDCDAWS